MKKEKIKPEEINPLLDEMGKAPFTRTISLYEALKRPEITYPLLASLGKTHESLPVQVQKQAEITAKYEGYIKKQIEQVESFRKLEKRQLPESMDYSLIDGLRLEARQKLNEIRPFNIGQASRISGVSPADISVLLIYMKQQSASNTTQK